MGPHRFFCAIGRNGIGPKRHEGDGITPIGRFLVIDWLRRADVWTVSRLDSHTIKRKDGWCDDPKSLCYNRQVVLPFRARTEALWRDDRVYDLVGLLNFNWRPRILGRGSAIFLHIAHSDYRATAGCVAVSRCDMQKAQWLWQRRLQIDIGGFSVRSRTPKMAEPTRT
ncbi:L,D-transpeptidase family protein [Rhodoblastus sp.]|uniref:L,D-transpeptidase family protein n=1 Tax=Rhodoblastus sp. TaxID=1962975 RepID=UPI003F9ACF47